jgi:hypothetical protein
MARDGAGGRRRATRQGPATQEIEAVVECSK